jgi:hypothetical protein
MSISGIGNYNYANGYEIKKFSNGTGSQFVDIVAEKSVASKVDYDEKAFEYVAPNAPEEVKEAWMEAAKETGTILSHLRWSQQRRLYMIWIIR